MKAVKDHRALVGSVTYFFPETSPGCRSHAFELMKDKAAMGNGTVTTKAIILHETFGLERSLGNGESLETGVINLQPSTEINGSFIVHRKMDWRWWRAQAVRYLMRFQSEYTCNLMNIACHAAFGLDAAKLVLSASKKI